MYFDQASLLQQMQGDRRKKQKKEILAAKRTAGRK